MSATMKEKWIDLVSLTQRFYPCDDCGYAVIEDKSLISEELYLYNLRIALRSVGHKITKITKCWNKDDNLDLICYKTTINKDQHKIAIQLFDDWISENTIDRNEESDSESEEDDPSV
jgi:hypothetical protein